MFTARYGLSPYITHIRFVFKGLSIWFAFCFYVEGKGAQDVARRAVHAEGPVWKTVYGYSVHKAAKRGRGHKAK